MREINARPAAPTPKLDDQVTIHRDESAYFVTLPRRGRLGDLRVMDGETGKPLNLGPTRYAPSEFGTIKQALGRWREIADGFDSLNGVDA